MHITSRLLAGLLLFILCFQALGSPTIHRRHLHRRQGGGEGLIINSNFPDPGVIQDDDGTWYAFSTNSNGTNIPVAVSQGTVDGPWVLTDIDAMPRYPIWASGKNIWAPFVYKRKDGLYVLYYAAALASHPKKHCIGTAVSKSITGPYIPVQVPLACPLSQGGAIDPAAFEDTDGCLYVVYKVDGNSLTPVNNTCGNTGLFAPAQPTPLLLQKLDPDGLTRIGSPIQLLDRTAVDGPLIEAPSLILHAGIYYLFYSSNCYLTPNYDVRYATATSVEGPYTRAGVDLLSTGMFGNLSTPGGPCATQDGERLFFHAGCASGRCLHELPLTLNGGVAGISG